MIVPAATKSKAAPKRDDQVTPKRALAFPDSPASNSSMASTLILPGRGEETPANSKDTIANPENDNMEGGHKLADNTKDKENQIIVTEQDKPGASKVLDEKQVPVQPLDTVKTQDKQKKAASTVLDENLKPGTTQPLDTVKTQEKEKKDASTVLDENLKPDTTQPLDTVKRQEKQKKDASTVLDENLKQVPVQPLDTVKTQEKQKKAASTVLDENLKPGTTQPLDTVTMEEKHAEKAEDKPSASMVSEEKPIPDTTDKKPARGKVCRPKASAKVFKLESQEKFSQPRCEEHQKEEANQGREKASPPCSMRPLARKVVAQRGSTQRG